MELIILMISPFYKAFVPTGLLFNPFSLLRQLTDTADRRQTRGCFFDGALPRDFIPGYCVFNPSSLR